MTLNPGLNKLANAAKLDKANFAMKSLRLDSLEVFAAIVRHGGFRAAAAERGVSSTALSQTIRSLEDGLGIRLLNRTTRSVAPTEAGTRLLDRLVPALHEIRTAIDDLDGLRERPSGTLRINAPGPAVDHVLCPLVFEFMEIYPEIRVELVSDAAMVDIVAQGFDAGVRFGQQLAQDMVAVPLGPSLRYAIVAAPSYLRRNGEPGTPEDLLSHDCVRRRFPGGTLVSWRFEKDGKCVEIVPEGRLTLSSAHQELSAALAGQGIAHLLEDYVQPSVKEGSLIELLLDWSPKLPSWFLYYPNRRHPSAAMRAFLDLVATRRMQP